MLPVVGWFLGGMAFEDPCPVVVDVLVEDLLETRFIPYLILNKIITFNLQFHWIYVAVRLHGHN